MPTPMGYATDLAYQSGSTAPTIAGDVVGAFDSLYAAVTGQPVTRVQSQTTTAVNPGATIGGLSGNTLVWLGVIVIVGYLVAKKL